MRHTKCDGSLTRSRRMRERYEVLSLTTLRLIEYMKWLIVESAPQHWAKCTNLTGTNLSGVRYSFNIVQYRTDSTGLPELTQIGNWQMIYKVAIYAS